MAPNAPIDTERQSRKFSSPKCKYNEDIFLAEKDEDINSKLVFHPYLSTNPAID